MKLEVIFKLAIVLTNLVQKVLASHYKIMFTIAKNLKTA